MLGPDKIHHVLHQMLKMSQYENEKKILYSSSFINLTSSIWQKEHRQNIHCIYLCKKDNAVGMQISNVHQFVESNY